MHTFLHTNTYTLNRERECVRVRGRESERERGRDVLSAKTKRKGLIMRNEQKIRQVGAQC